MNQPIYQNQPIHPISSSQNIHNNFVSLGLIGNGSFSQVHKVRRISDGKIYALKRIKLHSLKPKQQQYAISQIKILAALSSQYIISFRQSFYDVQLQQLCIVMEWANQGDLHYQIQKRKKLCQSQQMKLNKDSNRNKYLIPESQIWRAVRDILSGLAILHAASILHRDIKTANIFKSEGIYKLGDLNIAKICPGLAYAYTQTGTPYYASPQVWKQLPYNQKSDIWSFGCVIYQMCQLQPPFIGTDMKLLFQSVTRGKYKPINPIYSKQLCNLISSCLAIDPKMRKSCKEILQLSWVKNKFQQYNIRDQSMKNNQRMQTSYYNNSHINSNNSALHPKQLSIKLSKQLRQIRSITQPALQIIPNVHNINYPKNTNILQNKCHNILSQYSSNKINQILPTSNYPTDFNRDKNKNTNRSVCYSSCQKQLDKYNYNNKYNDKQKKKITSTGRPLTCKSKPYQQNNIITNQIISNQKLIEKQQKIKKQQNNRQRQRQNKLTNNIPLSQSINIDMIDKQQIIDKIQNNTKEEQNINNLNNNKIDKNKQIMQLLNNKYKNQQHNQSNNKYKRRILINSSQQQVNQSQYRSNSYQKNKLKCVYALKSQQNIKNPNKNININKQIQNQIINKIGSDSSIYNKPKVQYINNNIDYNNSSNIKQQKQKYKQNYKNIQRVVKTQADHQYVTKLPIKTQQNKQKQKQEHQCQKYKYKYKYKYERAPVKLFRPQSHHHSNRIIYQNHANLISNNNTNTNNGNNKNIYYNPKTSQRQKIRPLSSQDRTNHIQNGINKRDTKDQIILQNHSINQINQQKNKRNSKYKLGGIILRQTNSNNNNNKLITHSIRQQSSSLKIPHKQQLSYCQNNLLTNQNRYNKNQSKIPIHQSLNELPKIRNMLAIRSNNVRQQIGKFYYNVNTNSRSNANISQNYQYNITSLKQNRKY